jgi:hypothetical protein
VWRALVFIPLVVIMFYKIHKHYVLVGEQLRVNMDEKIKDIEIKGNVVSVPIAGITTVVKQSIIYAKSISENVIAVYIGFSPESLEEMEKE